MTNSQYLNERSNRFERKCQYCQKSGHMKRDCRKRQKDMEREQQFEMNSRNRGPQSRTSNEGSNERRMEDSASVANHAAFSENGSIVKTIYFRAKINGQYRLCLLDTGSEVTLLPADLTEGLILRPTHRTLLAANGSIIRLLGEVEIGIEIQADFALLGYISQSPIK